MSAVFHQYVHTPNYRPFLYTFIYFSTKWGSRVRCMYVPVASEAPGWSDSLGFRQEAYFAHDPLEGPKRAEKAFRAHMYVLAEGSRA